jgi:hypothetical protein
MAEFNEEFDNISVTEVNQRTEGWTFLVGLGFGDSMLEYFVDVDKDYWARLTNRRIEAGELVKATFKFLLDKESKELIRKKFNLADVMGYYPQYETEMKRVL